LEEVAVGMHCTVKKIKGKDGGVEDERCWDFSKKAF